MKSRFNLYLDKDVVERFQAACKTLDYSVSDVVNTLLEEDVAAFELAAEKS